MIRRYANPMGFTRLLVGFLFVSVASAIAERPQELPKPSDYVNDFAHVLSPNAVKRLDRICAQLDHSAANTQVAILTVHSLDGDDPTEWANKVEDRWRIGKKGSDRGVLVLLAVDDHKWRIDVGYGLEGILPDGEVGEIGRLMVPYLRARDYDDAVLAAMGKIAQVIAFDSKIEIYDTQAEPPVVPQPLTHHHQRRPEWEDELIVLGVFSFVLLWAVCLFYMMLHFKWGGRSGDSDSGSGGGGGDGGGSSSPSGGGDFGGGGAGGSW